jgi:hypothetical protein
MRVISLIFSILIPILLIAPSTSAGFFSKDIRTSNVFREDELIEYLPIITNGIIPDKIYGTIAESNVGNAYCYMFYWEHQNGTYSIAEHEHDWEFIVVYTNSDGRIVQVNYDMYHYYIGRKSSPDVYDHTHVLMYCYEEFHNFKPDTVFRGCNPSKQVNTTIYDCNNQILSRAQTEVSFDPELFKDPWSWQGEGLIIKRYTAFDSAWKAFWVVSDKEVGFLNFEDKDNTFTKAYELF